MFSPPSLSSTHSSDSSFSLSTTSSPSACLHASPVRSPHPVFTRPYMQPIISNTHSDRCCLNLSLESDLRAGQFFYDSATTVIFQSASPSSFQSQLFECIRKFVQPQEYQRIKAWITRSIVYDVDSSLSSESPTPAEELDVKSKEQNDTDCQVKNRQNLFHAPFNNKWTALELFNYNPQPPLLLDEETVELIEYVSSLPNIPTTEAITAGSTCILVNEKDEDMSLNIEGYRIPASFFYPHASFFFTPVLTLDESEFLLAEDELIKQRNHFQHAFTHPYPHPRDCDDMGESSVLRKDDNDSKEESIEHSAHISRQLSPDDSQDQSTESESGSEFSSLVLFSSSSSIETDCDSTIISNSPITSEIVVSSSSSSSSPVISGMKHAVESQANQSVELMKMRSAKVNDISQRRMLRKRKPASHSMQSEIAPSLPNHETRVPLLTKTQALSTSVTYPHSQYQLQPVLSVQQTANQAVDLTAAAQSNLQLSLLSNAPLSTGACFPYPSLHQQYLFSQNSQGYSALPKPAFNYQPNARFPTYVQAWQYHALTRYPSIRFVSGPIGQHTLSQPLPSLQYVAQSTYPFNSSSSSQALFSWPTTR